MKKKAGWRCQKCGFKPTNRRIHSHHIQPENLGGETRESNLGVACARCHRWAPESSLGPRVDYQGLWELYVGTGLPPAADMYVFGADHAVARNFDTWDVSQSVSALRPEVREEQSIDLGRMWTGLAWIADYGNIRECVPHDSRGMFGFIRENSNLNGAGDIDGGEDGTSHHHRNLSQRSADD